MAGLLVFVDAGIVGFAVAGMLAAVAYGWLRGRWAAMAIVSAMSLALVVYAATCAVRNQNTDLTQSATLQMSLDVASYAFFSLIPFLFRTLAGWRFRWIDFAFAGAFASLSAYSVLVHPGAAFSAFRSIEAIDAGWLGHVQVVRGQRNWPVMAIIHMVELGMCAHAVSLAIRGWRERRWSLYAALMLPFLLGLALIQNLAYALHWFGGPPLAEFAALGMYVSVGAVLVACEREFMRERQRLLAVENESQAFRKRVFDSSRVAIVVMDPTTTRVLDCNPAAATIYGFASPREAIDKTVRDVSAPVQYDGTPSSEKARTAIERALAEGESVFEWRHRRPDGTVWDAEVHLMSFRSTERQLLQFTLQDVSERKRIEKETAALQARLEQAQRLEALGTLAGGIAHDFNNILGAIIGNTEIALMEVPETGPLRTAVKNVELAAQRATALVRQILSFSRQTPHDKKLVQPFLIVKEVLTLIRATLPSTIAIEERHESSDWVLADPAQVHQIIMNLCTNAGLAMRANGGTLEVGVHDCELDATMHAVHPDLARGRYVRISVRDTGCGIDPAIMGRIFEPFFTTRPHGEGTGLGLSMVHGIVKSTGGAIDVESEVGRGTRFTVVLPVCEAPAIAMICERPTG
jgi:PAS domain S-box-containing protein